VSLLQILLQKYDQTEQLPIKQLIILYTPLQNHKYLCAVNFTYKLNDINNAATRFWQAIDDKKVIGFHGDMGSGKTTFIHALCEVKGVKDVVGSPTFSIINEYYFPGGMIYHIDLYRLKDEEEAIRAGVEDCLYGDHICFVEWPEKAPGIFPKDTVYAFIEVTDSETRHLTIQDK
jgi:tRNA threonylcarbamoyladenosine biosynthesis protein TsaE